MSMIGQNAFGIEGQCCKLSWSSCHLLRTYTGDGIGSIQPVLQPVFVTFKDGEAHLLIDSVSSNFNNYRRQQNRDLGTGLRSRSKQASTDGLERRGAERYAIFPLIIVAIIHTEHGVHTWLGQHNTMPYGL